MTEHDLEILIKSTHRACSAFKHRFRVNPVLDAELISIMWIHFCDYSNNERSDEEKSDYFYRKAYWILVDLGRKQARFFSLIKNFTTVTDYIDDDSDMLEYIENRRKNLNEIAETEAEQRRRAARAKNICANIFDRWSSKSKSRTKTRAREIFKRVLNGKQIVLPEEKLLLQKVKVMLRYKASTINEAQFESLANAPVDDFWSDANDDV